MSNFTNSGRTSLGASPAGWSYQNSMPSNPVVLDTVGEVYTGEDDAQQILAQADDLTFDSQGGNDLIEGTTCGSKLNLGQGTANVVLEGNNNSVTTGSNGSNVKLTGWGNTVSNQSESGGALDNITIRGSRSIVPGGNVPMCTFVMSCWVLAAFKFLRP